jgi:crotonobetainyl-CoA:carnitine CoA-transferase CaiB-like acyl-CoA transferase
VLEGYRPGVFDKYGFGQNDILQLVKDRPRGIIYARENCYSWQGPCVHRSGWQQISDAVRAQNNSPSTPDLQWSIMS